MTNADRIRAMTDEELAKLFNKIDLGKPPFCDGIDMCDQGYTCLECCEAWLKQEVSDNG